MNTDMFVRDYMDFMLNCAPTDTIVDECRSWSKLTGIEIGKVQEPTSIITEKLNLKNRFVEERKGEKKMNNNYRVFDIFVKSVDVYNNRAVKVTFLDGSFTTAECAKDDIFNLDVGITICLMKKMLEVKHGDNGTKLYNNLIRDIHKLMERNEEKKKASKEEETIRRNKRKKALEKKKRKQRAKIKQQVAIQEAAYLSAMRKWESENHPERSAKGDGDE